MIEVGEAVRLLEEHTGFHKETISPLSESVFRVLSEDIFAKRNGPPFARVAMDGVAISFCDWEKGCREFPIWGIQSAGSPQLSKIEPDTCIEVMTGAILPQGTDTVVPVEHFRVDQGKAILPSSRIISHQHVHPEGFDFKVGDLLLSRGTLLRSPEIAVLASNGEEEVKTYAPPRIVIVATGDELVGLDREPLEHQIWISNLFALRAELQAWGLDGIKAEHLPDNPEILKTRLLALWEENDMVIFSGGVSKGRFDYIPAVLESLRVEKIFHRVSQRPGQPLYFGKGERGPLIFGLPGNPVSSLIQLRRFVLPAIWRLMGWKRKAHDTIIRLKEKIEFSKPLTYFLAVIREGGWAVPVPVKGSGDFKSLVGTDGFVELNKGQTLFSQGEEVNFFQWGSR